MDVRKENVFDGRIVQNAPAYAVQKGGMSYSNSPFQAISATSSQMSFNVNVPSQNVFLDRELEWTAECSLQSDVAVTNVAGGAPPALADAAPVLLLGANAALAHFPLHQSVSTMTATINDTTSTINTSDVLNEVLRFVNQKKNRLQRTCPTMLDKYADYSQVPQQLNNSQRGYSEALDYDNVPNGAFYDVVFTDQNGNELVGDSPAGTGYSNAPNAGFVRWRNGVPVLSGDDPADPDAGVISPNYRIYIKYRSTEKLVLSPFVFSEEQGCETGLFGLNNLQLVMNFRQPSKLLRSVPLTPVNGTGRTGTSSTTIANVNYRTASPWINARVNCLFISPSLALNLPPKSVVPYMEYPRYITNFSGLTVPAGSSSVLQSQTIVLPQCPDMLVIYAKANALGGVPTDTPQFGDYYLPLDNISVNWDNFSGLLASHTAEQLYNISVDNGLEIDWNSWNGVARNGNRDRPLVNLVGGFLVLRFAKDIALQPSIAPGCLGNFTLQYNARCLNRFGVAASNITLFTMTINSGFFESQMGSSRIVKAPLTEADVIGTSDMADVITRQQLERLVGGSFFSKLGSALMKAKDVLLNPAVRQFVKTAGKKTPLKGVIETAERFGYGVAGGAMTGAAMTGAAMTGAAMTGGRRRKKPSLHSLME